MELVPEEQSSWLDRPLRAPDEAGLPTDLSIKAELGNRDIQHHPCVGDRQPFLPCSSRA